MTNPLHALYATLAFQRDLGGALVPAMAPRPNEAPEVQPAPPVAAPAQNDVPADTPWGRIRRLIPVTHPAAQARSLEELRETVAASRLIALDESRKNPVFGVGNPNATLMLIGEAPGADEDEQGEPFVGKAGQLLTKILAAIGFSREDVYIANILKSRPPGNRDPEPAEVAAHLPFLHAQIAFVQPRILLCLGRISAQNLLQRDLSLAKLREQAPLNFHGLPLYATYHPAALLRNPDWKRPTWEDVQAVRAHYDRILASA